MLNFKENIRVAVIGASGGIGEAFIAHLNAAPNVTKIYALSRQGNTPSGGKITPLKLDLTDSASIETAAAHIKTEGGLDAVITATGILHDQDANVAPEKSLRDINADNFAHIFAINTTGPALIMKHFLPLLPREGKSVFAALSARVGSISDNQIGGWYAYRASKSALNMLIKNASIEFGRRFKHAAIIGLHPGTVNTGLSEPFQGNVPEHKLFSPEYATEKMLTVLNSVTTEQTGLCLDYAGEVVPE